MTALIDLPDAELHAYLRSLDPHELDAAYAQLDAEDNARRDRAVDLRAIALYYASYLEWPVFPIVPGRKVPLVDRARGFTRGFKDATLDAERIHAAWTAQPLANIATPTGASGCGFDVLDIDGPDGWRSYLSTLRPHVDPHVRCRAGTPRGGAHLYLPASTDTTTNRAKLLPGIDVRGAGGYVLLAPSVSDTGRRYVWSDRPVRSDTIRQEFTA